MIVKKKKRLAQLYTIDNMKTKLKKILNQNSNKKQSFYFFSFLPWKKKSNHLMMVMLMLL